MTQLTEKRRNTVQRVLQAICTGVGVYSWTASMILINARDNKNTVWTVLQCHTELIVIEHVCTEFSGWHVGERRKQEGNPSMRQAFP